MSVSKVDKYYTTIVNKINNKVRSKIKCGKNIKIIKTNTCSICLQCDSQRQIKLPCGHKFHKNCFSQWVKHSLNYSCPLCRTDCGELYSKFDKSKQKYQIFMKRYLFKNVNIIDEESNLILNINIKNIYELLNNNYENILEKYYSFNRKTYKSNKVLFYIDGIKITHFLRNIIVFGPNKLDIKIKKVYCNDEEYYFDTSEDIVSNFNKIHFYNNYSMYEKICQLTAEKYNIEFKYQHLFHIWDLSYQYAGRNKVDIFKVIRYMLNNYIVRTHRIGICEQNETFNSFKEVLLYEIPCFVQEEYEQFKGMIVNNVDNIISGIVRY